MLFHEPEPFRHRDTLPERVACAIAPQNDAKYCPQIQVNRRFQSACAEKERNIAEGPRRMIVYGISSCDTCRKALRALAAAGHQVSFRDVRAAPLSAVEWHSLLAQLGDGLVNRASTTWRGLTAEQRALPPAVLLAQWPTLMKRPVIAAEDGLGLGWGVAVQAKYAERRSPQ
jgi:arsenate reductase-like glutaredoxin family protein